jgi:hypothetical protein
VSAGLIDRGYPLRWLEPAERVRVVLAIASEHGLPVTLGLRLPRPVRRRQDHHDAARPPPARGP